MSDGAISQDEIDALLSGVSVDGLNSSGHVGNGPSYHIDVPSLQKLASDLQPKLEENVNKYTGAQFKAETPVVEIANRDKVLAKLPEVVVSVTADYNSGVRGSHLYLLSPEFALKLFALVNNEEATEVEDLVLSVVSEILATHISAQILILDSKISGLAYATPESANESKAMIMFPQGDFLLSTYPLSLDGTTYNLWEVLGGDVAEKFSNALGVSPAPSEDPAMLAGVNDMGGMAQQQMGGAMNMGAAPQMQQMGTMMPNMGMNMGQQQMGAMNMGGMGMNMGTMMPNMGMNMAPMGMNMGMNVPNVQTLQFPNLSNGLSSSEQGNIGLIMDVLMEMTVELGRTEKSIKDILALGEGTIIELDKLAGEPVDILVNHKPIAKGEVVVIDENFGVRVTEILSPLERVSDSN